MSSAVSSFTVVSFTNSAVLVDRFEQLLHDDFWGDDYWNVCMCMLSCVLLLSVNHWTLK